MAEDEEALLLRPVPPSPSEEMERKSGRERSEWGGRGRKQGNCLLLLTDGRTVSLSDQYSPSHTQRYPPVPSPPPSFYLSLPPPTPPPLSLPLTHSISHGIVYEFKEGTRVIRTLITRQYHRFSTDLLRDQHTLHVCLCVCVWPP